MSKSDDLISRQAAIDAVSEAGFELRGVFERCEDALKALPSAQPSITLKDAVSALRRFLEDRGEFGYFPYTWEFHTKDGACLKTDWGYFEEGLDSIDQYIEAGGMNPNLEAEMRGENDEAN